MVIPPKGITDLIFNDICNKTYRVFSGKGLMSLNGRAIQLVVGKVVYVPFATRVRIFNLDDMKPLEIEIFNYD